MDEADPFAELMARVRRGDAQAATDLVRQYEPFVRREIRLRLEDRRLMRTFDSQDVCQSVMASFFLRAVAGQFDLNRPQQLVQLLMRMARNKMASAARAQTRQRRDHRRITADDDPLGTTAANDPTPSRIVADAELLVRFRDLLSVQERQMADLRAEGLEWKAIAEQLGGTAQSCRMQFSRAVSRAARALGL